MDKHPRLTLFPHFFELSEDGSNYTLALNPHAVEAMRALSGYTPTISPGVVGETVYIDAHGAPYLLCHASKLQITPGYRVDGIHHSDGTFTGCCFLPLDLPEDTDVALAYLGKLYQGAKALQTNALYTCVVGKDTPELLPFAAESGDLNLWSELWEYLGRPFPTLEKFVRFAKQNLRDRHLDFAVAFFDLFQFLFEKYPDVVELRIHIGYPNCYTFPWSMRNILLLGRSVCEFPLYIVRREMLDLCKCIPRTSKEDFFQAACGSTSVSRGVFPEKDFLLGKTVYDGVFPDDGPPQVALDGIPSEEPNDVRAD